MLLPLSEHDTNDDHMVLQYQKTEIQLKANHEELIDCWTDLAAIPIRDARRAAQPAELTLKLLPFQQEGLDWMTNQEKSIWNGGLLADEMVSFIPAN